MPESQSNVERVLVTCSLWMLIGFVGATAVAAGILQLFDGEANWLSALALIVCGGILTATSWHRGQIVLDDAEQAPLSAGQGSRGQGSRGVVRELPRRPRAMGNRRDAGVTPPADASREKRVRRS
jgi:hypothetical protein